MSNELSPLDPSQWETVGFFRETFLGLRFGRQNAQAARSLAWDLYRSALQIPGADLPPEGALRRGLMALARDLRHDQGFLQALGTAGDMGHTAVPILQLSRSVAESLGRLAGSLETGVRFRR